MMNAPARYAEEKDSDITFDTIIFCILPLYAIWAVFVVFAAPFLLIAIPIHDIFKDKPKLHGKLVLALVGMIAVNTIVSPIALAIYFYY